MGSQLTLTILLLWTVSTVQPLKVDINLDQPIAEVEKEFLSFTIDCLMLVPPKWKTFNFSSPRVQTLLRGLSPAYLRLGGTTADQKVFTQQPNKVFEGTSNPTLQTFNTTDVDNIASLMRATNIKFLLDLNLQQRYGIQWNPTNTATLLGYITKMKYQDVFHFELGNEPDDFPKSTYINGTQIGKDFRILHNLLTQYNFTNFTFVGPDSGRVRSENGLFSEVINEVGDLLTAATFHHYYFDGRTANVSNFINPNYFSSFQSEISLAKDVVKKSKFPNLPIWMGEGGVAYHQGAPNISDRYVDGFLWLDKLGVAAKEGLGVVMRQDYYGLNYPMTDVNNLPNPDYWLSYLHKQLVGQKVLSVLTTNTTQVDTTLHWESFWNWFTADVQQPSAPDVRVYAHCTKPSSTYHSGSVTMFALNVNASRDETLTFPAPLSGEEVHIYLLTPVGSEGLTSKQVALNGKTLLMKNDHTLPQLIPRQQPASHGIKLPALTFGFFVFPDANAPACK